MSKIATTEGGTPIPAGTYKTRFFQFSTRNEAGAPIAKSGDRGLVVFMQLEITDGDLKGETIPASADLESGLAAWCQMFTDKPPTSNQLVDIEKQMAAGKIIDIVVGDSGWARGPAVPKAAYLAKFAGFTRRNESGEPILTDAEYKKKQFKKVFFQLKIAAGDKMGALVPASCSYPIKRVGNDLELPNKSNLYAWCIATGVDFENLPEFRDMDNVLPELEQVMLKADRLLSIQVGETGWVESSQASIAPAPQGVQVAGKEPVKQEVSSVGDLYMVMNRIADEQKFGALFDSAGSLTDAGKKFASEHIRPICEEKGIPRNFVAMSNEQAKVVIEELVKKFGGLPKSSKSGEDF